MQSTGTVIMLDQNQSEFNKSQLVLKNGVYPPYGFALKQAGVSGNRNDVKSNKVVLGEKDPTEHNTTTDADDVVFKDAKMATGIREIDLQDINNGVHPVLLEAYKRTKQVRIKAPVRVTKKLEAVGQQAPTNLPMNNSVTQD